MPKITIDPNEMAGASNNLQGIASSVGEIGATVQAQACGCELPPSVASQVAGTVASVEAVLRTVRVELLLHATVLALRGLIAAKDSLSVAAASALGPATVGPVASGAGAIAATGATATSWAGFKNLNGIGGRVAASGGGDPIIAAAQNGAAMRKLATSTPMMKANLEFRSKADLNSSGRIGDLKLG